jgi:Domain of unknown function (DUF6458)
MAGSPSAPGAIPHEEVVLGIGTSIFLIAVGAILRYAVTADAEGVNLDTVGLILMIVGVVGLALSVLWMAIWADRRRGVDGTVVREREVAAPRERVVERDVV